MLDSYLLPDIPQDLIEAAYGAAPGNEIETGKFSNPASSSALVANGFGWFLSRKECLPCVIGELGQGWQVTRIDLEREMRFPWSGGRHPWLDVAIEIPGHIIGIESKRYEPFRGKSAARVSEAYFRDVWGSRMDRYSSVLKEIRDGRLRYTALDAAQLVKHAFGLRTNLHSANTGSGDIPKKAHLLYLYAEPRFWPDARDVDPERISRHRDEISDFADRVRGDEVAFHALDWSSLLDGWERGQDPDLAIHALRVRRAFGL